MFAIDTCWAGGRQRGREGHGNVARYAGGAGTLQQPAVGGVRRGRRYLRQQASAEICPVVEPVLGVNLHRLQLEGLRRFDELGHAVGIAVEGLAELAAVALGEPLDHRDVGAGVGVGLVVGLAEAVPVGGCARVMMLARF